MGSSTKGGGQIGMATPETDDDRTRWAAAAPRMAMALSEAGYPTRFELFWTPGRENELVFTAGFPPKDVLLRAGALCGVRDLVAMAVIDGGEVSGRE